MPAPPAPWAEPLATALLVLADGTVLEGFGIGQTGIADGEVCFNTAMTGYQEILTDPSYAGQIVTFTFPHIGNTGTNDEDLESLDAAPASGVRGTVIASAVTNPSSWRSSSHLDAWLKARGIVGITGVDTRALTALIRDHGMPNADHCQRSGGALRPRGPEGPRRRARPNGRPRPRAAGHQPRALRNGRRRPGGSRAATADRKIGAPASRWWPSTTA